MPPKPLLAINKDIGKIYFRIFKCSQFSKTNNRRGPWAKYDCSNWYSCVAKIIKLLQIILYYLVEFIFGYRNRIHPDCKWAMNERNWLPGL